MKFPIYDYLDADGANEIKKWTEGLQSKERGKLKEKIDKLAMHGEELYPQILTDSGVTGIQKLRVQGSVKLRPLLCRGPMLPKEEYTFLLGAKEIGGRFSPKDAPETASKNKKIVAANAATRRGKHERVS